MRTERLLALGGLAWAVLFVATFAVAGEEPAADAPASEIDDYFTGLPDAAMVVYALSVVALIAYLAVLAVRLPAARDRSVAVLGLVGGGVFVVLQAAGDTAFLSLTLRDGADLGGDQARTMLQLHEASHVLQAYPMAVFVAAVGLAAWRTGLVPRWVAWSGGASGGYLAVTGTLSLAGSSAFGHDTAPAMVGFLLFIVWVGASSVAMARTAPGGRTVGPAAGATPLPAG